MVLKIELLLKLLCAIVLALGVLRFAVKRGCKRSWPVIVMSCILCMAVGQTLVVQLPHLTQSVTVTATGEKNEASNSTQVLLLRYEADGVTLDANKLETGNWLCEGTAIRWVPPEDPRTYPEITQEVSRLIPVGWERYLCFATGPDLGVALVTVGNEELRVDLYALEAGEIGVLLPETPIWLLGLDSLFRVAVFSLIMLFGMGLLCGGWMAATDTSSGSVKSKLKKYGFLFQQLVHRDFTKKYKRTVFGMAWSILLPLLQLLVLYYVFSAVFAQNIPHYITYLFSGQLVYNYYVESTNQGMGALLENAPIFTKVNVPKYLFVFSKNISSLINFLLTLVVYFLFCVFDGITFAPRFFFLLYPVLCLIGFNIGMGMILSALNVFFRDTQYLYSVFTTILMWCSAVFYSLDTFTPHAQRLFNLNPVYVYINYFRTITIGETIPSVSYHLLALGYAFLVLVIGAVVYKKYNHRFLYYV